MALEGEISRWNGFARALRKDDQEAFDELMDICRSFAMAGGNATNPIILAYGYVYSAGQYLCRVYYIIVFRFLSY